MLKVRDINENIKNILWNTFENVFYSVCQWLIIVSVVRIADFEAAGFLALAMKTSSSFSVMPLSNMRNYLVSDEINEHVDRRVLSCAVIFVICTLYTGVVTSGQQILCIVGCMLVRIVETLADVSHGINQKYNCYNSKANIKILGVIA